MPEINGFGVLEACREIPFQVIFTTAVSMKAFKYSATGYLLVDREPVGRRAKSTIHEVCATPRRATGGAV